MLTEAEKNTILACMDALRQKVEGFRPRRPQMEMVAQVAGTLARCRAEDQQAGNGDHIAVIEAGTGTGKTFGALVPALVMARSRKKRLVVSSSTVALQQQYAEKDVPALQQVLPISFTFAVAKGRRRYACPVKLAAESADAGQQVLELVDGNAAASLDAQQQAQREVLVALAEDFAQGRWDGDRDELESTVPDELWRRLTTDRDGCPGNKCREFSRCPFYLAKQRAREADLVIANHDLVLSALEANGKSILPPTHDTLFVFDEAHHLGNKVVEHFSQRHALEDSIAWADDSVDAVRDCVLALHLERQLLPQASEHAARLADAARRLADALQATGAFDEKPVRRFKGGQVPDWVAETGRDIDTAAKGLRGVFGTLREAMLKRTGDAALLATRLLTVLGFYIAQVDGVIDLWSLMLADDTGQAVPTARWIERTDGAHGGVHVVCAAPISGGDKLRRLLWNRASGAVAMSATLSSCGTFDLFLRQTGLKGFSALGTLQVASPFDYRGRAQLVFAGLRNDPTQKESHADEVARLLPGLLTTRGTLVLFASGWLMRRVHERLPPALRELVLRQGLVPKAEILARHREAIDRGGRSVIFGLQSLAEGVDLPGDYCTHVVIPRLPFASPDSPLEEARREWIEGQGRSYFREVSLPEAARTLKQWVGRLLRTLDDSGTVTILDKRIATKRWGAQLLAGLPDFEVLDQTGANGSGSAGARKKAFRPDAGLTADSSAGT